MPDVLPSFSTSSSTASNGLDPEISNSLPDILSHPTTKGKNPFNFEGQIVLL